MKVIWLNGLLRFFLLTISLMIFKVEVSGQREADNWAFGWDDGINFSTGEPVPIDDINLFTFYGSTSLSDNEGNLLFYSNGVEILNRENHNMPHSDELIGSYLNPNPCIAFPMPGTAGKYYLFTVGGTENGVSRPGAEYSVIDMSLDGGLGDLVEGQINVPLVAADSTFEIITALKHGSRDAYWVILRNHRSPNKMLSFLVDATGVHQTPVVSPCILYYPSTVDQTELAKVSAYFLPLPVSQMDQ